VPPPRLDRPELADAYRELAPRARSVARAVLGEESVAEDVAHDVFLRLWIDPGAYDPTRGSLAAYVSVLARSRALDVRRRAARWAPLEDVHADPASATAEQAGRRDAARGLLQALAALPEEQRTAVLLAGAGLTDREIAASTRAPLGTVKSRVRLGRRKLVAALAYRPSVVAAATATAPVIVSAA
jgi:RNA polymerase sigma-70 factor, ECF subfamily